MATDEQNQSNLETRVRGLRPGERLPIDSNILRAVFGPDMDAAIKAAQELAARNNCVLQYKSEQGIGVFRRLDG